MNCVDARKLVHLFTDGALDARANVDVLAHLNMCAACSGRFEDARRFEEFLKSRLRPDPTPEGVRVRLELLVDELAAPWPVRVAGRLRRRPVAATSGVAVMLALAVTAWQVQGRVWGCCPYVSGSAERFKSLQSGGTLSTIPTTGSTKNLVAAIPWGLQLPDFRTVGSGMSEIQNRNAGVIEFARTSCPEGKKCAMLFFIDYPCVSIGDHEAVTKNGTKFTQWDVGRCRLVCWKNQQAGLYCIMVCHDDEMDRGSLLELASVAAGGN